MGDSNNRGYAFPWPSPHAVVSDDEIAELRAEVITLRAEMKRREEAAYLYGLGSAAEVHRQNQLLAQMVAALIDPTQRLNVRAVP